MLGCSNAARAQRKYKLPGVSNFHVWHKNLKVTKYGFILLSYVRVQTQTGPARAPHRDERAHVHIYAGSFLGRVIIKHVPFK